MQDQHKDGTALASNNYVENFEDNAGVNADDFKPNFRPYSHFAFIDYFDKLLNLVVKVISGGHHHHHDKDCIDGTHTRIPQKT